MNADSIRTKLANHAPSILGKEAFAKFAVLIPLIEKEEDIHVLFEVRSHKMRRQPGEICFPGGKIDRKDNTEKDAAIRETMEELGVKKTDIQNVYPVDFFVSPFGMLIYPYAGFLKNSEEIEINPFEVAEVFTVPLSFFLEKKPDIHQVNLEVKPEEGFPIDLIPGGETYDWRPLKMNEYFYVYHDKVIWGLTAKIITHFAELMKKETEH